MACKNVTATEKTNERTPNNNLQTKYFVLHVNGSACTYACVQIATKHFYVNLGIYKEKNFINCLSFKNLQKKYPVELYSQSVNNKIIYI